MIKKIAVVFLLFIFVMLSPVYAVNRETVNQIDGITKVGENRVSKIVELREILTSAADLSRNGEYQKAVDLVNKITAETGFQRNDIKSSKVTLFQIHKRASNYKEAVLVGEDLTQYHPVFNLRYQEANYLLSCQRGACNETFFDEFMKGFYKEKEVILPPKGHDLMSLAILVRIYEVSNQIEKALGLVEEYFSEESLKFHKRQKTREGLKLLKEALLRDKREGKNIYAQQLINTTDYFGFV